MAMELDVLSPCAAGGLIDEALARSIDCSVIAGAATNPLTCRAVATALAERGILFVAPYHANCGGLIHVSREWYGECGPDEGSCIERAMDRLDEAIVTAAERDLTPHEVAERQALERVELARPER